MYVGAGASVSRNSDRRASPTAVISRTYTMKSISPRAGWLGALGALIVASAAGAERPQVKFEPWSNALFARAKAEHRFVLLDLAAVWCHWCHVMEDTTYRDPAVVALVGERFIAARADQDADPELSRRYEDWGWPATIVFAPDGSEIVKRRGYLPPQNMASLLRAIIDDPSPGPSVRPEPVWQPSANARLPLGLKRALERRFRAAFDAENAGWGTIHKYLDAEAVELALGEPRYHELARRTLDAALALIDPVWGGMYQYSDQLDWKSPHYEKLMSVQAQAIDAYVMAWRRFGEPRYLEAARAIGRCVLERLGGDGPFYVSQDADVDAVTPGRVFYALDDAQRRARPAPRVDTHAYPRENGWAIASLASLAAATAEPQWLARAKTAAAWIEAHRRRPGGGYAHGDPAAEPRPFLGDSLAMGEAYARLAELEPDGPWRARAALALDFIDATFADPAGGYRTAPPSGDATGVFARPARLVDENVAVARLAHRLGRAELVAHAMKLLASPTLIVARPFSPGVLTLARELGPAAR